MFKKRNKVGFMPIKGKRKAARILNNLIKNKNIITAIYEEKQTTLAAIVDSSDDAIISKTLQGIITSWNRSATKMFGYTEEEAIGKHISLIIPSDRLAEETVIIESIRAGKKIDHIETVRVAKDGTERYISLTVSPVRNEKGKIIGASKIARDISFRIEAEKQRQLYTQQLQELSDYKDEFMVMASHELKTPLTVILGNLQILQELMAKDAKLGFVNKTYKQALKLSSFITNLLDVSKINAGKLELNKSVFDLNLQLKEILDSMQQTTKKNRLIYNGNTEKLMVNADHERIGQVIVNLISNSIKYMPSPGDINIDAYSKDGKVIVSVRDQGIGIPEKDIEKVFMRFYRVAGTASSFSGSGIGLFISSEIIKAHQGRIWAESEINKGSTFYFSIATCDEKV